MLEVTTYKHKIDLNTVDTFGSYGCNLYKDGEFIESRVFTNCSGQMFMNEARENSQFEGLKVEMLQY